MRLRLQVPVHQVDLLLAAKALADVLRPDLADAVDGLQLAVSRGEQLLEPSELVTIRCTTSLGSRGMRPRMRNPRGETG